MRLRVSSDRMWLGLPEQLGLAEPYPALHATLLHGETAGIVAVGKRGGRHLNHVGVNSLAFVIEGTPRSGFLWVAA